MITSNYLASKGEEYKLGYFAAMNEKHGNADFVVRNPSGNYEAFSDFSAAIKSMKPVSRLFAPFVDGPVSSPTQTATTTTKEQKTSKIKPEDRSVLEPFLGGGVETKTDQIKDLFCTTLPDDVDISEEKKERVDERLPAIILSAIHEARAADSREAK